MREIDNHVQDDLGWNKIKKEKNLLKNGINVGHYECENVSSIFH